MPTKQKKVIYKSFEQFQAQTFPNLSKKYEKTHVKNDPKSYGLHLANEAIDQFLGIQNTK